MGVDVVRVACAVGVGGVAGMAGSGTPPTRSPSVPSRRAAVGTEERGDDPDGRPPGGGGGGADADGCERTGATWPTTPGAGAARRTTDGVRRRTIGARRTRTPGVPRADGDGSGADVAPTGVGATVRGPESGTGPPPGGLCRRTAGRLETGRNEVTGGTGAPAWGCTRAGVGETGRPGRGADVVGAASARCSIRGPPVVPARELAGPERSRGGTVGSVADAVMCTWEPFGRRPNGWGRAAVVPTEGARNDGAVATGVECADWLRPASGAATDREPVADGFPAGRRDDAGRAGAGDLWLRAAGAGLGREPAVDDTEPD